jgi:hypothetical protein
MDNWGIAFKFPAGEREFSPLHSVEPPVEWVAEVLSSGVKLPGHGTGYWRTYSGEIRNACDISPHPLMFLACCLIKHKNNFTDMHFMFRHHSLPFRSLRAGERIITRQRQSQAYYLQRPSNWYSGGGGGVLLDPIGTTATNRSIVPAPGDYDDGEIGGMMIGRGKRSTRRKPAQVPLCAPQTPPTWKRTRAATAAVGSQRLTAWAMARPTFV